MLEYLQRSFSQIGFNDPFVALDVSRQTFSDLLAVIQHGHFVGNIHHDLHIVFDEQDGQASLITETPNPPEDVVAKHPLRAGQVTVHDIEENPGFYRVAMSIMPHFQIEGMDITLSLVGKMPKSK